MTVWRKGKAPSLLHWPPGRRPETEERARLRSARRRIAARFRGIAAQAPRPAVSMRRPPTRGPRDPWTPRTVSLRGHLCEPLPRRPTLDGPAHKVHLHDPLRLRHSTHCGKPRAPSRRPRRQNWLAGFPAPRTPPGTLTPRLAAHVAFLFIGLAGLPAPLTPRSPPHPAPPTKNAALSRRVLLCMLPAAGMRRGVIRFGPSLSWRSGCGPSGCPGPSPAARRRG